MKKRIRKRDVRELIREDLERISISIDRSVELGKDNKNWVSIAIQMYDVNRLSARVLCAMRELNLPIKLDVNYLDYYKGDLFGSEEFGEYIELEESDYGEE